MAGSDNRLTRAQLLKAAAVATPGLMLGGQAAQAAPRPRAEGAGAMAAGMNVILFMTDQERAIQHFPRGWAEQNLPGLTRLQRTRRSPSTALQQRCMCSPARATLMTGYFPAQHGVKYTLEHRHVRRRSTRRSSCRSTCRTWPRWWPPPGTTSVYKGKWHLNKPADGTTWVPQDVNQYGFTRWNPPDAGANQDITEVGGGGATTTAAS